MKSGIAFWLGDFSKRSPLDALPLTYGADVLHGAVNGRNILPYSMDLAVLSAFCAGLFALGLRNPKTFDG